MLTFRNGELLPNGEIKMDAEPASWVTINGNRIPLNSEGKAIGGNPKALGEGKKEKKSKSEKTGSDVSWKTGREGYEPKKAKKGSASLESIKKEYEKAYSESDVDKMTDLMNKMFEQGMTSAEVRELGNQTLDKLLSDPGYRKKMAEEDKRVTMAELNEASNKYEQPKNRRVSYKERDRIIGEAQEKAVSKKLKEEKKKLGDDQRFLDEWDYKNNGWKNPDSDTVNELVKIYASDRKRAQNVMDAVHRLMVEKDNVERRASKDGVWALAEEYGLDEPKTYRWRKK